MPVYKYTLIKYLKAYSTWIIMLFSIFLIFILVGVVAFGSLSPDSSKASSYAQLSVLLVGVTTSFMALFASIFSGFKAASMYKDEVEDGTFLIMLSKPVRRSKIIFFKWLALLTIQIIYTLILALTFLITILIFDNGRKFSDLSVNGLEFYTLSSQIVEITALMWVIWMVAALIFSSIALLISTKLSVGTTIGIVTGLGVVTPMTGMIGMFTQKPAYTPLNHVDVSLLKEYEKFLPGDFDINLAGTPDAPTLYNFGIATKDQDTFQYAWIGDINYQVSNLSLIPSSAAIPDEINDFLSFLNPGGSSMTASNTYVENKKAVNHSAFNDNLNLFDNMINNSWNILEPLRESVLAIFYSQTAMLDAFQIEITDGFQATLTNLGIDVSDDFFDNNDLLAISNYQNYQNSSIEVQANYFQAIQKFDDFYNLNYKDFEAASTFLDIDKLNGSISILERMTDPTFWINNYKTNLFLDAKGIAIDTTLKPDETLTQSSVALTMIANNLVDVNVYAKVASAIDAGYEVTVIESKEYVSRYYILYGYIGIALALVPIAYFIVRRQDYR